MYIKISVIGPFIYTSFYISPFKRSINGALYICVCVLIRKIKTGIRVKSVQLLLIYTSEHFRERESYQKKRKKNLFPLFDVKNSVQPPSNVFCELAILRD